MVFGRRLPPEIAARVPGGQRLAATWPVLHLGPVPAFDEATWTLDVGGAVEVPFRLTYAELRGLGPVDVTADMHCVTGWSTLDNVWTGIPFRVLAERARPRPGATWVMAICEGGYTSNLSLAAMMDEDVLVAWGHGGGDLTPEHGFPLRLVVPKRYAWKSAKWIRGFEFMTENRRGFWEELGYHVHAEPFAEERYAHQERPGAEREP